MRVNPNMVPDVLSAIASTQEAQAVALRQISSSRRVNQPSDDPAAAAALVQNHNRSDLVDQYTQNGNTVMDMMQAAESSLSSVVSEVSQAVALGVEGANGTLSSGDREILAQQVSGILDDVVSQANLSYRGAHLFAGTATTTVPFTVDTTSPSGYKYNGNGNVNSVVIGDGFSIPINIAGDQLFQHSGSDLLGSLQQLATALRSGDTSAIGTATNQLRGALDYLTEQRVFYGNITSQIKLQESFLQNETVNIKAQETSLVGVDMATAATNFSQAQTASQATLAAAAKVLPQTLLDYLR
jgi:flagellar hook-associated protein 3 FlgL